MVRFLGLMAWLGWWGLSSPAGAAQDFSWQDTGLVPYQASRVDPRFPYMMYVPEDYDEHGSQRYPLVVLMHGTERGAHYYLEQNIAFAEEHDLILLAPLFPVGTHGGQDLENYKFLDYRGTRYDLIVLSMVDEVRSKYRIRGDRFGLFGFSGGGHFAHRFFYLHPHHLYAVSIGAPGVVTRIDDETPWWVGTGDVYWRFNARLDPEAMARVKVQMVIGAEDRQTWEGTIEPGDPYYMEGVAGADYNAAGDNRIERMKTLRENFRAHGIEAEMVEVPGVGHRVAPLFPPVRRFLLRHLPEGG